MSEVLKNKIKKINKLVKVENFKLDEEKVKLSKLNRYLHELKEKINTVQIKYLEEVEKVNAIRDSSVWSDLQSHEENSDYYKNQWLELNIEVRKILYNKYVISNQ